MVMKKGVAILMRDKEAANSRYRIRTEEEEAAMFLEDYPPCYECGAVAQVVAEKQRNFVHVPHTDDCAFYRCFVSTYPAAAKVS